MKTLTDREIIKYFGNFDYKEGESGRMVILWHPLTCCSPELYVEGIRGPGNPDQVFLSLPDKPLLSFPG